MRAIISTNPSPFAAALALFRAILFDATGGGRPAIGDSWRHRPRIRVLFQWQLPLLEAEEAHNRPWQPPKRGGHQDGAHDEVRGGSALAPIRGSRVCALPRSITEAEGRKTEVKFFFVDCLEVEFENSREPNFRAD